MSLVIGVPSKKGVGVATTPYRKAPMTTALPSYTTSRDVTGNYHQLVDREQSISG
jgi:hypothetical protein